MHTAFVTVLWEQSCPTLYGPTDYSLPGSSIHGIFQARILEFLFQRIFLTQRLNHHLLHFLHWQADSLPQSPPGKPKSLLLSKSPSLFSSSYSICRLCGVVKWIIRKICEAFLNVVLVKAFSRHLLIFSCFVLIPICFQNKVNAKHSYRIYIYKIYKYTIY